MIKFYVATVNTGACTNNTLAYSYIASYIKHTVAATI